MEEKKKIGGGAEEIEGGLEWGFGLYCNSEKNLFPYLDRGNHNHLLAVIGSGKARGCVHRIR